MTFLLTAAAQSHSRIVHQRGVHTLAARQQRGNVAQVHNLLVVQCRAVNSIAACCHVLLALCRHGYLLQLQVLLLQTDVHSGNVLKEVHRHLACGIAQTLYNHRCLARRHVLDAEVAFSVGHGPTVVVAHNDGSKLHGLAAVEVDYRSCHGDFLRQSRRHQPEKR